MKWPSVRIDDICDTGSGGTPSRADMERYFGGSIPWVKSGELREQVISNTEETITQLALDESAAKIVPAGALLVALYGATVGRIGILGIDAATNQAVCYIVPRSSNVDNRYLFHALKTCVPTWLARRVGGAQPNISQQIIKSTTIPLPPLGEQRRIAAVLDRAEALRAKRRAALAQLDTLTQAIFLEMFGDPVTNPKGWTRKLLGDLIVEGPQNGIYKPASDYGTGTPILRIDAFYDGAVSGLSDLKRVRITEGECELYGLRLGNIVVNRVNSMEYLGKSAIISHLEEPTVFESNMMRFGVDQNEVTPVFLIQFLQTNFIKGQIVSAAKQAVNQSSINQQDVKSFVINVPPLPLQQTFAERVAAVERLKASQRASLGQMDELFAALQQRAFAGEL